MCLERGENVRVLIKRHDMIDESTKTSIWQSENNDRINIVTAFYQDPVSKQEKLFSPMLMTFSFEPEVQGEKSSKQHKILIKQTFSKYRVCRDTPSSVKETATQTFFSTSKSPIYFISFLQKYLESVIV